MSIQQEFKSVLLSNEITNLVIVYENGGTEIYSLDEEEEARKAVIKIMLQSIDWSQVAEVKFIIAVDKSDN